MLGQNLFKRAPSMRRLQALALALAGLLSPALGAMKFLNPPPFGTSGDYSDNPTYLTGSVLEIRWTPGPAGTPTSVTMWQVNATTSMSFGEQEHITRTLPAPLEARPGSRLASCH